jgi:hypothetical protein
LLISFTNNLFSSEIKGRSKLLLFKIKSLSISIKSWRLLLSVEKYELSEKSGMAIESLSEKFFYEDYNTLQFSNTNSQYIKQIFFSLFALSLIFDLKCL